MEFLDADAAISMGLEGADVYYTPEYGRSAELIDIGRWECALSDDGLVFPYIRRDIEGGTDYDIVSPYGYGGVKAPSPSALADFRRAFLAASRERGLVAEFLRAHPVDMNEDMLGAWSPQEITWHTTFGIRIGDDPDTYFTEAEGRHRTAVRKALKSGIHIIETDLTSIATSDTPFRTIYAATMERVGASSRLKLGDEYFHRLSDLGPGRLSVLEAKDEDGDTVAAAIFMTSGSRVHYHLSGATPAGQKLGATNLVIDHAVRSQVHSNGWLHLGGGVTVDDGLYRFKKSIGNTSHSMAMCRTVVNANRYDELVTAAGSPDTSFFPAYRGV